MEIELLFIDAEYPLEDALHPAETILQEIALTD
jgi:hypothetical protein